MTPRICIQLWFAAIVVMAAFVAPSSASATPEGPRLSVTRAELDAALRCSPDLAKASHPPVLLTPAFSTADASYGWNYLARLPKLGIPTCAITVPDSGYGDLQATAEYVVAAVRWMRRESGRDVVLFGHQHGALDELWALKFWPDVARKVSDLISLATPYNGTSGPSALCGLGAGCAAATRQIGQGSGFIGALAAAPLPRGPSYTSIASLDDMLITPQPAASRLEGAVNIEVQDICPGRQVSHFDILSDAVAYRLVIDGIENPGPANPASVPASACSERMMPDSDPLIATAANGFLPIFLVQNAAAAVPAEPVTRPYASRTGPVVDLLTHKARLTGGGRLPVRVACESIGRWNCRVRVQVRDGGSVIAHRHLRVRAGAPRTVWIRLRGAELAGKRKGPNLDVALSATDSLGNSSELTSSVRVLAN